MPSAAVASYKRCIAMAVWPDSGWLVCGECLVMASMAPVVAVDSQSRLGGASQDEPFDEEV